MINKQILTLLSLCSLCFISCGSNNSGNTKQNFNNDKYTQQIEDMKNLDISIEYIPSKEYPLNISVGITNNTDHNILLFHDYAAAPQLFSVIEDGRTIPCLVLINYVEGGEILQPGASFFDTVPISYFYAVTKGTHNYEITYQTSNTLEFDITLTRDGGSDHN